MPGYKAHQAAGLKIPAAFLLMKKIIITFLAVSMVAISGFTGCRKDKENNGAVPDTSELITFCIPVGWPQPSYTFQNNALTQQGFELGRKLFYDVRLSRDNTVSCASCHAQFAAFAHLDHSLSHGIDGLFGTRNAQGIFNMAWKPFYFWDGGVINLENQPINPIENPVEMDEKIQDVVIELGADAEYKKGFKSAFGDETINSQRIFKALAQFMAAIVSADSKYDKHVRGEQGGEMTQQELNGMELFRNKCATCHKEPLFTDYSFRNNGLRTDPGLNDSGRAHITAMAEDRNKYMVPSLRNVNLTRPYMHDGRFTTLDAALEHYRSNIVVAPTLDPALISGIAMTDNEKEDIIAFLKTLSDTVLIKDKRFSERK
jgi:cytochrome c peroxidase